MELAVRMPCPEENGSDHLSQKNQELEDMRQSSGTSRSLATAVLEASDNATLIAGNDGRLLDANSAALQLFGILRTELPERSIQEFIGDAGSSQTASRPWLDCARAGRDWAGEVTLNRRSVRAKAEIRITRALPDAFVCVIRERVAPVEREERMRELVEAARQELQLRERIELQLKDLNRDLELRIEERTAALQESHSDLEAFCYSVSHDLRAPLRSMQGFAMALVEDHAASLNAEGNDFARRILKAAQHMDGLLRDVLAFSRLSRQALVPEPVELDAVVREVCSHHDASARGRGGRINVTPCGWRVLGNLSVVELMLSNLVDNALKFIEKGRAPEVTVRVERAEPRTRIWICDNGIGIPPEQHQKIFRIFERLHGVESFPGTGIGLALVQKAAERLNGAVGVESTPGQGSSFWIELPSAP